MAAPVDERAYAREAILSILPSSDFMTPSIATAVARLAWTNRERDQVISSLLSLLSRETSSHRAGYLADAVTRLSPSAAECAEVRKELRRLLLIETDAGSAQYLAERIVKLEPTTEECMEVRQKCLIFLFRETWGWRVEKLADAVALLGPTLHERELIWSALVAQRSTTLTGSKGRLASSMLVKPAIAATADERARARKELLQLLVDETNPEDAIALADAITTLDPTDKERSFARKVLAAKLPPRNRDWTSQMVSTVTSLKPRQSDRSLALRVMLREYFTSPKMQDRLTWQASTSEDKAHVRRAVLRHLVSTTSAIEAQVFAHCLAGLDPTSEQLAVARQVLIKWLTKFSYSRLADELAYLRPGIEELAQWSEWGSLSYVKLLAALRRDLTIDKWLEVLPLLSASRG
jgi:hypothetical protein